MRSKEPCIVIGICAAICALTCPRTAHACTPFCAGEGPTICVQFDNFEGPPEEDVDFVFYFTDPDNPSVDLLRGRDLQGTLYEWRVWSMVAPGNPTPANIGSVTAYTDFDYGVKIRRADGYRGAHNVALIDLRPGQASKYSDLTTGWIAGNLTGDLYVQKSSTTGQGGVASLTIDGDAQANLTIPNASLLSIGGDASGLIEVGKLTGALSIDGDLLGDITVTQEIDGGTLDVGGDVGVDADVEIADILGSASLTFGPESVPGEFSGDLALLTGIPEGVIVTIYGPLTPVGQHTPTIDLNEKDVAGKLMIPGAGDGDIINGGAVTNEVRLGGCALCEPPDDPFSGEATFASIGVNGIILACPGNLSGDINILGDLTGVIVATGGGDTAGNLTAGGRIVVSGDLEPYAQIKFQRDIAGEISIAGSIHANAWIWASRHIAGPVAITGQVDGQILANADAVADGDITGDVTVSGEFDGNICGDNLYPDECLPENIDIQSFGPDWTVCDEPGCICDLDAPTTPSGEEGFEKNRYLSFVPANAGLETALRVTLTATDIEEFEDAIGRQWWIGSPDEVSENAGKVDPGEAPGWPTFWAATLQCTPYYLDWDDTLGSGEALHVFSSRVVPASTYEIQAIHVDCDPEDEGNFSTALVVTTSIWGDVVGSFVGGQWQPPDGSVDVVKDVTAVLDKFKNLEGAPIKARCDVEPEVVNRLVEIPDVTRVYEAFQGQDYPFNEPSACP